MLTRKFLYLLLCVLLTASSTELFGQKKVLRFKPTSGVRYQVQLIFRTEIADKHRGGKEAFEEVELYSKVHFLPIETKTKVSTLLASYADFSFLKRSPDQRISYDVHESPSTQYYENLQRVIKPIFRKRYEVKVNDLNNHTSLPKIRDVSTETEINLLKYIPNLITDAFFPLPQKAVSVGNTWSVKQADNTPFGAVQYGYEFEILAMDSYEIKVKVSGTVLSNKKDLNDHSGHINGVLHFVPSTMWLREGEVEYETYLSYGDVEIYHRKEIQISQTQ